MGSRTVPQTAGVVGSTMLNGNDFIHREQIASYYQASVINKRRLKSVLVFHMFLIVLMLFRLSVSIFVLFDIRPPHLLQRLKLPRVWYWEYAWMLSGIATILGLLSIRKNRMSLLKQYLIGTIVLGLLPCLYGSLYMLDDLLLYWEYRDTKLMFLGYPVIVLWNMLVAVFIQVHGFGLFFGWSLLRAWRARLEKKKTP